MKVGARNQLAGEVTEIQKGQLMAKAKIRIDAPAVMSSVFTVESLEELGLNEGDKVKVYVKAIHVLLVKE